MPSNKQTKTDSKQEAKKESRPETDHTNDEENPSKISFSPPHGKAKSVSFCHSRICYLLFAIAAIAGLGFAAFKVLDHMGWLPFIGKNALFQGTVTASELAAHNTADNCWVAYYNKVYIMTDYAGRHPGGASIIANFCGAGDATAAYEIYHPESLLKSVQGEYIGDLVADDAANTGNIGNGGVVNALTMQDVALHDIKTDCWVVYYNQVYDMSDYAKRHPGGRSIITDQCGSDGTSAYSRYHKQGLLATMTGDLIGALAASSTPQQNNNNGDDDDDSDDTPVTPAPSPPQPGPTQPAPTPTTPVCTVRAITILEVQQHNQASDCWLAIHGTVYDLTNYQHPVGNSFITKEAGTDATAEYARFHSVSKLRLVTQFKVGVLSDISGEVPC